MTLESDFQQRNDWFNNRSSAIFPVAASQARDVRITFLNYWKLRKFPGLVRCNLRVYEECGGLAVFHSFLVEAMHNDISLAGLLKSGTFSGAIEVEFTSAENLRYPFPAVTAWYANETAFSAVHSAGRVKNGNEPIRLRKQIETNWTCVLNGKSEPFFHLFNGNIAKPDGLKAQLTAYSACDGRPLATRALNTGIEAPYASRIFRLSECVTETELKRLAGEEFFLGIELDHGETFPRLVVGNYRSDLDHYAVTHSYPWLSDAADVTNAEDGDISNMMIMVANPDLDLEAVAFPTNIEATVTASTRSADLNETLAPLNNEPVSWKTGGEGASVHRFRLNRDAGIFEIRGRGPARINASYRYSVKGAPNAGHATDIASGFKAIHYPPKHSHWGTGVIGHGFDTAILLSNSLWNRQSKPARGVIKVFLADQAIEHPVLIESESAQSISLAEIVGMPEGRQTVSWFLNVDQPTCDANWVSYHPDGRISGDHAF